MNEKSGQADSVELTGGEAAQWYQRLVEICPDAVVILQDDNIVSVNEAAVKLYGATAPEKLFGRSHLDFTIPDQRAQIKRRFVETITAKTPLVGFDQKLVRINGHIINVRLSAVAVTFCGKPALQAIIRDVTEDTTVRSMARASEEFLRKSETQLRLIWEKSLDGMRMTDEHGIIYMVNQAYCNMVGLSREKLEGQPLSAPYEPGKSREIIRKHQERFRKNTIAAHEEKELHLWNGRKIWFEFSNSYLELEGQRPLNLTIFRDITERKRAELRTTVLASLGRRLGSAATPQEAGRIIVDVADQMFVWDACTLCLYSTETNLLHGLVVIDTLDGKRTEIPNPPDVAPSAVIQRVITNGAEMVLRTPETLSQSETVHFGDKNRRSASLLYVPIRHGQRSIGIFSIQSYAFNAYTKADLQALQALADHCGGALERLLASEALQQSEQRFRKLSESIPIGVFETRPDGYNVFNNIRWQEISGMPLEQATGWGWANAIHPDDREGVLATWKDAAAKGIDWIHEHRLLTPLGTVRWVHAVATPVFSTDGQRTGYVGTVEDVTERRRVERRTAALSMVGQKLSAARTPQDAARVISEVADELFKWDAFSLELYSIETQKYYAVLNIDTLDGKRVPVPSTNKDKHPSERGLHVMKHGAQLVLKEEIAAPLNGTIPFGNARPSASIMSVPLRRGTDVLGVLSVHSYDRKAFDCEDLQTLQMVADHCGGALDRIRAEEAYRHSELRLQSVWENSVDGMRLTDKDGIVVAVNEAYCQLAGVKRHGIEGKVFTSVYEPSERLKDAVKRYRDRFEKRIVGNRTTRKMTFRNGKVVDLEDTNSFIELPDGDTLLLSLFRDVTRQKRLEEELRQSQKMESVGQLAGGIAHDFNNILTVIKGHAALLLSDPELPPTNAESIEQISGAAERAANLTRQLLAFSRKQIIQPRNIDINEVISNLTNMLQRLLTEDVSLQVDLFSNLPCIHADVTMTEQILLNLVVNARDAMPQGGRLFIKTSLESIDEKRAQMMNDARVGQFVCLRVKDTGCGISSEHLPKIFEPFFTTKDIGKGTGLGLATVYGIVKQHQGWIHVISNPGDGATFEVFLPAINEAATQPVNTTGKTVSGGRETVLIVEDEAGVRALARAVLTRAGYRCIEAESGVEALRLWKARRDEIDVVLTDVVMPDGVSGRELAERLQLDKKDIKVVFTSGYPKDVLGADFVLRDGMNFLQKPYPPQRLTQVVRECLDSGKS